MKIVMLVSDLTISGGYQKLALRTGVEFTKMGHKVVIYTPRLNKKTCHADIFLQNPKIKIVSLKENKQYSQIIPRVFKYLALSNKIIKSDLLIIHNEECLLSIPFLKLTQRFPSKIVWMLNNQFSPPSFALGKKLIEHFSGINNLKVIPYLLLTLPALILDTLTKIHGLNSVNSIACYDSFNCRLVKQSVRKKAYVVFAGADLEDYRKIRSAKIINHKPLNILSVGVMFSYRRYEDIIKAVHLLKQNGVQASLSLVGKSEYAIDYFNKLKRLTNKYDLKNNVIFYDFVKQKELFDLYQKSHIFCFVNDANSWGMSAFEAVSTGMPVVISSNVGASDLIKNQTTGWVVPPKKPTAIADAIMDIIKNPKSTQAKVRAAKDVATKLLTWRSFAERVLKESISNMDDKN